MFSGGSAVGNEVASGDFFISKCSVCITDVICAAFYKYIASKILICLCVCVCVCVLFQAYSLVDREVGYCQGSAFIVGLLLMQVRITYFTCKMIYYEDTLPEGSV